jgi:protein SCO1
MNKEALAEFEASQKVMPSRFRTIAGAAAAARHRLGRGGKALLPRTDRAGRRRRREPARSLRGDLIPRAKLKVRRVHRRAVMVGLALTVIGAALPLRLIRAEIVPPAGTEIPFELVDTKGGAVRGTDLHGRWVLVFTFCPDLCPTVLNEVAGALAQLGPLAAQVQPVFVSIDPQRDTPEALREYVQAFDERILPLTGTADQLARAAKAFGVAYFKVPGSAQNDYTFAHSAIMTLIGPEGGLCRHGSCSWITRAAR